jgi:hypothetical protein
MRAGAAMVEFTVSFHREPLRSDAHLPHVRVMDSDKHFISHQVAGEAIDNASLLLL